ncbi:hypothetical protein H6P81_002423 [Aristolochia fimbriata]|uniref:Uncharacterized protein n=1 Tax=Aristolochia fimbriata TaxID=158543 RepID=A0AAV7FCL1_ARIFI|nr:hypothetical protein H6P81_002423 [Aristolochia fimbriata]
MGNYISRRTCDVAGKIILPDGTVQAFEPPVAAGELMLEHSHHFIVEYGSVIAGNKPSPLPSDQKLEPEKTYLMIPMKSGKVAKVSAIEAREILAKVQLVTGSEQFLTSLRILPRFARICSVGLLHKEKKKVGLRKETELETPEKGVWQELLAEEFEKRPEFLSRELSGKGWKPSLDTIKEKAIKQKVPHWLFQLKGRRNEDGKEI